jgi:hypothetical protein
MTETAFRLPINQCLALAERRISDAAWALESNIGAPLAIDLERQARDFLAEATAQGWTGDAGAVVAAHWKTYRG